MDGVKHQLQTDALNACSKAELDLSKERLTTKHMREEIGRLEREQRETKQACDERVDTLHKSALERVESIQKQMDSVRSDALESERKLRDDKLDLQKEMSALKVRWQCACWFAAASSSSSSSSSSSPSSSSSDPPSRCSWSKRAAAHAPSKRS